MVGSVVNSLASSSHSLLDEMGDTSRIRAFVPAQRVMCMNEIPDIRWSEPTSSVSSPRSLKNSPSSSVANVSMTRPARFGSSPHMTPFTRSKSDEQETNFKISACVPAQRVMCMKEMPDIRWSEPTSSVSNPQSLKSSKSSSVTSGLSRSSIHGTDMLAQFPSTKRGSSPRMASFELALDELTACVMSGALVHSLTASRHSTSDEQEASPRVSTFIPAQRVMCMNEIPDIRWSEPTSSVSSPRSLKNSQSSSVASSVRRSMIHTTDMLAQFPSTTRGSSPHMTSFGLVVDELTACVMSGVVVNSLTASKHSTSDAQEASPRISDFVPGQRVMCMNEIPDIRWSEPTSSVSSSRSLKSSQKSSMVNVLTASMTSSAATTPQIPSTHQATSVEVQPWERLQDVPGVEQVHQLIGVGTFSYVFLCTTKEHNGRVAAKLLKPGCDKEDLAEALVMTTLTHPNVVRLLQFHSTPVHCLLLEFCEGGSLHDFFYGAYSCVATSLRVRQRARMILDVFLAVEYLHSRSIIHRDIKSRNCFLTAPVWDLEAPIPPVKLGDFGLARAVQEAMTRFVGTVVYMAPELTTTARYGTPVDIYSCCVLLHEAVSVQFPFSFMGTISQTALIMKIVHGWRPLLSSLPDDDCSEKLGELMGHGWGADPTSRVDAAQLIARLEQIIGEPAQGT